MSNNINRIRKNKLKGTGIFAAAALTAALIAGNNIPGVMTLLPVFILLQAYFAISPNVSISNNN